MPEPVRRYRNLMDDTLPFARKNNARRKFAPNLGFIRTITLQCVCDIAQLALGDGVEITQCLFLYPPCEQSQEKVARTRYRWLFVEPVGPCRFEVADGRAGQH